VVVKKPEQLRRLFRFEIIDVVIAMVIASSVNAAMLITAAAAFHTGNAGCRDTRTGL
jgi:manganese transport protein